MTTTPFDNDGWRLNVKTRRDICRAIVLECLDDSRVDQAALERSISALKQQINYSWMSSEDQNIFNVAMSDLRMIAEGWQHLEDAEKRPFVLGKMAPSGLARLVRQVIR